MTTAEKTVAMLNSLPEAEQISVQKYIKQLLRVSRHKERNGLKPITKDEFIKQIDHSRVLAKKGKVYTMEQVRGEIAEKYGF